MQASHCIGLCSSLGDFNEICGWQSGNLWLCLEIRYVYRALWIQEEKELLQEVAGMGELHEPWHTRQVELLDRHLHLLHLYSQAKENLEAHKGMSSCCIGSGESTGNLKKNITSSDLTYFLIYRWNPPSPPPHIRHIGPVIDITNKCCT